MKKQTRQAQGENRMHQSLVDSLHHQDQLSFDQFACATLERRKLLEREEYLKSKQGATRLGQWHLSAEFLFPENEFLADCYPKNHVQGESALGTSPNAARRTVGEPLSSFNDAFFSKNQSAFHPINDFLNTSFRTD